jgi:peptide-methionine (S)-S-oxide reductase
MAMPERLAAAEMAFEIPPPAVDTVTPADGLETAVLAGGCFWGVQAIYQHMDGVQIAVSGYSGGSAETAHYQLVGRGNTGHAEAVEIRYDPEVVSFGEILHVFFSVAHNPTQLNFQGPDRGPQYRSAIFYTSEEQQAVAEAYIAQLEETGIYQRPIVTEVAPLTAFYPAEDYHQDYLVNNPNQPYIVYNDLPKLVNFQRMLPQYWRDEAITVAEAQRTQ